MPPKGQQLTPEQAKELESSLDKRFKGVDKAHRWGVMRFETEMKSLSVTPKDAEFLGTLTWSLEEVARAYKVPLDMIGGQRTYENVQAAERAFWSERHEGAEHQVTRDAEAELHAIEREGLAGAGGEPELCHEHQCRGPEQAAAHPELDLKGTLMVMTPGQNDGWATAFNHNPQAKYAFDVWATHPYPYMTPPWHNIHDGDLPANWLKTIDSYIQDLDECAKTHNGVPGRRGFPVMITETNYGWFVGNSTVGWPKLTQEARAPFTVDAFFKRWYEWPEILAVHPWKRARMRRRPPYPAPRLDVNLYHGGSFP